jgi:membrane protease YdiL (CAAX protease family)
MSDAEFLFDEPANRQPKPSSCSYFREVPWRWTDILIGVAPMLALRAFSLLAPATVKELVPGWLGLPLSALNLTWLCGYTIAVARRRIGPWRPWRLGMPAVATEFAIAVAGQVVITATTVAVFVLLMLTFGERVLPTAPPLEPLLRSPRRWEPIALGILAIIGAPIAEETFFRGLLYNALRRRLAVILAAPLSALIFGFLHPFELASIGAVSLVGLVLALLYEWRRTILAPMLLHSLNNSLAMGMLVLNVAMSGNSPDLGVSPSADRGGARVQSVAPGSGAAAAGLQPGDLIKRIDNVPVTGGHMLRAIVGMKKWGDSVVIDFERAGQAHRVTVVLKHLPPKEP